MGIQRGMFLLLSSTLLLTQVNARTIIRDSVPSILINAVGGMKYDLVRFKVKPGQKVNIVFTNTDDMSHNFVITSPGARPEIIDAALKLGADGPKMSYIPQSSKILWSIPLLSPGEMRSITFTAPRQEGVYPYVCTYPGHGQTMYGAMYVTNGKMPSSKEDPNIPPKPKKKDKGHEDHSGQFTKTSHPYEDVPPFLYRVFIPDAGPAAIAVTLPHNLSYCWDAGACRLRYAWEGGFDNTDLWHGHRMAYTKIEGTVFFRDKTPFPLRLDIPGNIPAVQFKGYRILKDNYPEFHYTIDGIEVYELLTAKADGTGLVRTFRIPETNRTVWFVFSPEDGVSYAASAGKWINGKLKLSPGEARKFTIVMTKKEGGPL